MLLHKTLESTVLQRILAQSNSETDMAEQPSAAIKTPFWTLPGFGAGARITTSFGHVPVEALRRLDAVKTRDGSFLKVQHVDTIRLDRRFLLTHPDAQPIAIPKNGLAAAIPNQAILMSGCQKIRSPGQFDQVSGRLAVNYLGLGNVTREYHGYFTYYLFHCGEPCTVNVNGLWVDLDPNIFKTNED